MSRYYDDVLCHHGRKNMHWGVRNGPPYPLNSEGNAKFKENVKKFADGAAAGARKVGGAVANVAKKAKASYDAGADERSAKKYEKKITKLAKDPGKLYRERSKYSSKEISDAIDRINLEKRLKDAKGDPLKKGMDIVNTLVENGRTVNNLANVANDLLNNYDKYKKGDFSIAERDKRRAKAAYQDKLYDEVRERMANTDFSEKGAGEGPRAYFKDRIGKLDDDHRKKLLNTERDRDVLNYLVDTGEIKKKDKDKKKG